MVAIQKVACSPDTGGTPATNEKAMLSGTCIMATVNPEMISLYNTLGLAL
jgi:hypothetical protein